MDQTANPTQTESHSWDSPWPSRKNGSASASNVKVCSQKQANTSSCLKNPNLTPLTYGQASGCVLSSCQGSCARGAGRHAQPHSSLAARMCLRPFLRSCVTVGTAAQDRLNCSLQCSKRAVFYFSTSIIPLLASRGNISGGKK